MPLGPGSFVGRYEIVARLGAGGVGEVYCARDPRVKRHVALKVLPHSPAGDSERFARYRHEAVALAALNHRHIAAIHDIEEENDLRALVSELVEGDTLAERIAKSAIPSDEALPIARSIADALEAAHSHGIIHGDLKPSNIKLPPDGIVKVLDFGLVQLIAPAPMALDSSRSASSPSRAARLIGVVTGTAAYMSPEQARGASAGFRSDIWAFGCVLYEMLTGRRAFDGEDIADTLAATLEADPDWSLLPPTTPSSIALLLRRCLEKDLRTRLDDMGEACIVIADAMGSPAATEAAIRASVIERFSHASDLPTHDWALSTDTAWTRYGEAVLQDVVPRLKEWAHERARASTDLDIDALVHEVVVGVLNRLPASDVRDVVDLESYLRKAVARRIVDALRRPTRVVSGIEPS